MAKGPGGPDLSNPPTGPTPTGPISPGVGQQAFNPNFMSFLPASGTASAQLADKPTMTGNGIAGAGARPAGATDPAAAQRMAALPRLQLGNDPRIPPLFQTRAKQIADSAPTNLFGGGPNGPGGAPPPGAKPAASPGDNMESYLRARDQMAKLRARSTQGYYGRGGGRGGGSMLR